MPEIKSLILYRYPEQVICDKWIDWSETYLNKVIPAQHNTPRGFQTLTGSEDASTVRTIAKEFFDIGLLKGHLINPQSGGGGRGSIPSGVSLLASNNNVHTRLGFIAYAIGKGLSEKRQSDLLQKAFNGLCAIILLQNGFEYNENYFLTVSIFERLKEIFTKPKTASQQDWLRYLATGMFSTLKFRPASLLDSYINGQTINSLVLVEAALPGITVTPVNLGQLIENRQSLTDITPKKSPLFWIGGLGAEADAKGLYSRGANQNGDLLKIASEIEQQAIINGSANPFAVVIEKQRNGETVDVIKELEQIFHNHKQGKKEWSKLMKTLRDGVLESLQYIEGGESAEGSSRKIFYAHGIDAEINEHEIQLEIEESNFDGEPTENDLVVIASETFTVENSVKSEGDTKITVSLKRIGSESQNEQDESGREFFEDLEDLEPRKEYRGENSR